MKYKKSIIPYISRVVPIMMACIQDESSTQKRVKALNALTKVISSSGFVILPYYVYPNLFNILTNIMKMDLNRKMRKDSLTETVRLMGAIGALDPHLFKKIQTCSEDTNPIDLIDNHFKH